MGEIFTSSDNMTDSKKWNKATTSNNTSKKQQEKRWNIQKIEMTSGVIRLKRKFKI